MSYQPQLQRYSSIDAARCGRLSLAGAFAGLLVFLLLNGWLVRLESSFIVTDFGSAVERGVSGFLSSLALAVLVAILPGVAIIVADEFGTSSIRIWSGIGKVCVIGIPLGIALGISAQLLFSFAALLGGICSVIAIVIIGRAVAWGLVGCGAGFAIGYSMGSFGRAKMSCIGGLIGGCTGGLLFDVIAFATMGGSVSRFVGFIFLSAAIGLGVALSEDIGKQCWLRVLSGPKKERTYIITKPTTTIGRDERADIPMFGDPTIQKQHAVVTLSPKGEARLQAVYGAAVAVNGVQTADTPLRDGDVMHIGPYALGFYRKGQPPQAYSPVTPAYSPPVSTHGSISQPPILGVINMVVVAGPHQGERFQIDGSGNRVGREMGCRVYLERDLRVSRCHAEIGWDGTRWFVQDLGSTNGTTVNGVRVMHKYLIPGDRVGVGDTVIILEML